MTYSNYSEKLSYLNQIIASGYPAAADKLPELVTWLQDTNKPGSKEATNFLLSVGAPVIPQIRIVLAGDDRQWQHGVLWSIVDKWPRDLVIQLEDELVQLIQVIDAEEVDIAALRQLAKHHIGSEEVVKRAILLKRGKYKDLLVELDEIDEFLHRKNESENAA